MSEQNKPQEQNENTVPAETDSDTEHTKEFRLNSEDIDKTKEFKIESKAPVPQEICEDNESSESEEAVQEETTQADDSVQTESEQVSNNEPVEELTPKKEKFSFKNLPKSARIAIIAAAVSVVVLLVVVIVVIILKKDNIENNCIIVYRKGNECVIRIDDKETSLENDGADNFKADKNSKRVYYTVPSSQDTEYFDLYYVQLEKGEISKPTMLDNAIESTYEVINNNVYYLKYNTKTFADDGCVCDMNSKSITTFSSNVNGIYCLNSSDVYFTKPDGENLALYYYTDETVEEISRNVTQLCSYAEAENPHVIYQTNTGEYQSASSLYITYAGESPELICDNANMVALDEYQPGGNLYYFTSSQESISWSYVISDQYSESDKNITEPKMLDYLWDFLGLKDGYDEAVLAYAEKTARDKIRKALDETAVNGGLVAPVFSVFAYDGSNTVKLAEGVDPSRVYSYAPYGEPKIVFEKTSIKQGETDIATLCEMSKRSGIEEVIAYAKSIVTECVESQGVAVAVSNAGSSLVYELKEYDKNRTVFRFSENGDNLFAVVSDNQGGKHSLYCNTFGASGPATGTLVSANVKSNSVAVNGEAVVYIIADTGKETGDVFSYEGGKNTKISNSASEFVIDESKNIFVIKNADVQDETVSGDYYTHFDGKEIEIGKDVLGSAFVSRADGSAAFVENNKLMIYHNGETVEVSDGATQLLLYK